MARTISILLVAASMVCGCKSKCNDGCGDQPVVAPTVITNTVPQTNAPALPPYIPWWVKEGK